VLNVLIHAKQKRMMEPEQKRLGFKSGTRSRNSDRCFREAKTKDRKLKLGIAIINVLPLRLRTSEAAHIFMKGDIFRDKVLKTVRDDNICTPFVWCITRKTHLTAQPSN
jgi:hypothetical protein